VQGRHDVLGKEMQSEFGIYVMHFVCRSIMMHALGKERQSDIGMYVMHVVCRSIMMHALGKDGQSQFGIYVMHFVCRSVMMFWARRGRASLAYMLCMLCAGAS